VIAAVAWRREATLLAHAADIDRVARVIGVEVDVPVAERGLDSPVRYDSGCQKVGLKTMR